MIFFVGKFYQKLCRMMMMFFLLQKSRSWSCFKLIAVIDCASKMMMSCARVVMHFFCQICCSVTRFFCIVSSKNNRRDFLPLLFSHIIHKYWTRNSFYSIFGLWFGWFFAFNRVFQTFEKPMLNKSCSLCMSKCRLVYW